MYGGLESWPGKIRIGKWEKIINQSAVYFAPDNWLIRDGHRDFAGSVELTSAFKAYKPSFLLLDLVSLPIDYELGGNALYAQKN